MRKNFFLLIFVLITGIYHGDAQEFNAVEGSIYGGSVNTYTQPGAGVNMPYRWDVEVVGVNSFWNNNIFSSSPTQWETTGDSIKLNGRFLTGKGKRWGTLQADVHLLNFLFRLPRRQDIVIGAGWNLHGRAYADRLDYIYEDSMKTMSSFLQENAFNTIRQARVVNQQWMEWYVTASAVIFDDQSSRFTAGATLKLLKGMGAVVADLDAVSVGIDKSSGTDKLVFTSARGRYGYSKNLGDLDQGTSGGAMGTLMQGAPLSPGFDIGITYLKKKKYDIAGFANDDAAAYDWKFEAALTNLGRLKYPLGDQSIIIKGIKGRPEVQHFARMMDSVSTLNKFNDSLATMAELQQWSGSFSVSLPTSLHINIDKNMGSHFYLNAGLNLDMSFLNPGVDYKVKQLSYLMLTPRWEIKRMGIYAPLYINTRGSLMAGAAVRLGPLLAGVHDFGWLFHNSRSGGAYVALVIRGLFKDKSDCPTF
jgi:hypothetical protein